MRFLPGILVAAAFVALFVGGARLEGDQPATPDLTGVYTEDLISQFQDVSAQSIGAHSLASAVGFVAIDAPPRFAGGVLGAPPPVASPAMREITRRGIAAVPALLNHLSDARPTKLTVGSDKNFQFMSTWYSDEYAARDPAKPPAGVSKAELGAKELGSFEQHQLKVGDLCFVTLGQIVNRPLAAARYQPTACLVVNSPVQTPALDAAARADWTGLTAEALKDSLLKDVAVNAGDPDAQMGALQRLMFYYPQEGKALAIRWLARPLYDTEPVQALLDGPLLKQDNARQQDQLLKAFRKKYGPVYHQAAAQAVIDMAARFEPGVRQPFPEQARRFANADKLARRRFAAGDSQQSPDGRVEDCADQQRVVEALAAFPSVEIDAAARDLLKRALDLPLADTTNQYYQAQLACACARRLCSPERSKEVEQAAEKLRASIPRKGTSPPAVAAYGQLRRRFLRDVQKLLTERAL